MAQSRKTTKRKPRKKSSRAKSAANKKSSGRGQRATGSGARGKRSPRKRSTASAGLEAMRKAGRKTWKTLKDTTAQVVEGVKDTLGG